MDRYDQTNLNWHFMQIQKDCNELFNKKNTMYEASFFKQCDEDGDLSSAVMRLKDKINRISALVKSPEKDTLADESIKDTLKDLANYAIMSLVYLEITEINKSGDENAC